MLTVDDDPAVSRAVARDLRRHYGEDHRIVRAESGPDALDTLKRTQAARRNGRDARRRLPDAADDRHRIPRTGDGPVPGGATGAADRLRRHATPPSTRSTSSTSTTTCSSRGTHRRRSSTRSSTRCWTPGKRRPSDPIPHTKVVGHRWSARSWQVRDFLARNGLLLHLVHGRRAGRRATPAGRRRGRPAATGRHHRTAVNPWSSPPTPNWRTRWA